MRLQADVIGVLRVAHDHGGQVAHCRRQPAGPQHRGQVGGGLRFPAAVGLAVAGHDVGAELGRGPTQIAVEVGEDRIVGPAVARFGLLGGDED